VFDAPGDYVADVSVTPQRVTSLLTGLRAAYAVRNSDYDMARRRYRGEHWDADTNPAVAGRYSLTANYVRPAVRGGVRDLLGRMPGIQAMPRGVDEEARRVAEGSEALLYKCWDENEAHKVFRRVAFNMLLLNRGWIYYWWDPDCSMVKFRSVSPENVYELRDGEDVAEVVMVSRRLTRDLREKYPEVSDQITPDNGQGLGSIEPTASTQSGTMAGLPEQLWQSSSDDPRSRIDGEYTTILDYYNRKGEWLRMTASGVPLKAANLGHGTKRVPFIEFANDFHADEEEPESEIPPDVVELNQYLDRVISRHADIIDKYTNPTIIDEGTGQEPATIRRVVQGDGAVLPIRKGSDIRFLLWEGTFPMIGEQADRIQQLIYDLTGRPGASYGQTLTNQSGVMTNLALSPTVGAASDRQVIFSGGLVILNAEILRLTEKFAPQTKLSYQGYKPKGPAHQGMEYFEVEDFKAADIKGWYRNRIKWPAVLRTDDPTYVQTELSKAQATAGDAPKQSIYTTLENLGIEDVEAELDRIAEQLADPRFHPDRLTGAINAATALSESRLSPEFDALMPGAEGAADTSGLVDALGAAGNPNRDAAAQS
jgi:hypothetical protein